MKALLLIVPLLLACFPTSFPISSTVVKAASSNPTHLVELLADNATNVTAPSVIEMNYEPVSYKPMKVTFNFQYNQKVNLIDISTVGNSSYKHGGGPTYYEFICEDIDDYSFTLQVDFGNASVQTILIGMFSGNTIPSGTSVKGNASIFRLHFRLRVTLEPTFPSKEELAQEYMRQTEQLLVEQEEVNRQLLTENQNTMVWVSIISVVCFILIIACLMLTALTFRTRRPGGG